MAHMKYARASVVRPHVSRDAWATVRTASASKAPGNLSGNLIARAAEFFGGPFDINKYLLTHATIIASVDAYAPQDAKLGSVMEDGRRVNRRFADFRVKTACDCYINNNLDAWSRPVIMKAHSTFVGAHNFVEHVQLEDLSKGRIIDAVARDIGDSVYVDILIATDKQHRDLVAAIESGKMGTLSMGCTVDGTICTKCGHWAADETEMCPHIKYQKGNTFFDEQGRQHRIAELCGHESLDPTGGVTFIEASWVEAPAFTGAVKRNVLVPNAETARRAYEILSSTPPEWSDDLQRKAASEVEPQEAVVVGKVADRREERIQQVISNMALAATPMGTDEFLAGWMDDEEVDAPAEDAPAEDAPAEDAPAEAAPAKSEDPLKGIEDELAQYMTDRLKKRFKDQITQSQGEEPSGMAPNETLAKQAAATRKIYLTGLKIALDSSRSDIELMDRVSRLNQTAGVVISRALYLAALEVGPLGQYSSNQKFEGACKQALKRNIEAQEMVALRRLSLLLNQQAVASKRSAK